MNSPIPTAPGPIARPVVDDPGGDPSPGDPAGPSAADAPPTLPKPARAAELGDQQIVFFSMTWDRYVSISDAMPERTRTRAIFVDGRLTLLGRSRRHEIYAELLGYLFVAVARGLGITWEPAGSATYRSPELGVGVEADKTFYLGDAARAMRGPVDIDLTTQPPPSVTFEVELTHPAHDAMRVYARLGVPEVWRLDVEKWSFAFCLLGEDGQYRPADQSMALAPLTVADVIEQLRMVEGMATSDWIDGLPAWVRDTLLPRVAAGE